VRGTGNDWRVYETFLGFAGWMRKKPVMSSEDFDAEQAAVATAEEW
jgi:hypothetical protein